MIICITKLENGSFLFTGYLKRIYYGYTLTECKRRYRQEAKETGFSGRLSFVMM